ncbi:MAG: hypothetical protein K0S93_2039, partial [Nitrososphaeraceae archaeon]|nr:hypothetical protein [Nitrososphaeraceae archaeon]
KGTGDFILSINLFSRSLFATPSLVVGFTHLLLNDIGYLFTNNYETNLFKNEIVTVSSVPGDTFTKVTLEKGIFYRV